MSFKYLKGVIIKQLLKRLLKIRVTWDIVL